MAAPAAPDTKDEQIAKIERTLQEVEQQAQRFLLLKDTLRAQIHELKNGPAEPPEKITNWKGFLKDL